MFVVFERNYFWENDVGKGMNKHFENFQRVESASIRQFQRDFEKVIDSTDCSREVNIHAGISVVRNKLECLLTDLELEFLKKDGIEVKVSDWKLIWTALIKMHDSLILRALIEMGEKEEEEEDEEEKKSLFCSFCKVKGHDISSCWWKRVSYL